MMFQKVQAGLLYYYPVENVIKFVRIFVHCKAENAGGLMPVKDDNAAVAKKTAKLSWFWQDDSITLFHLFFRAIIHQKTV